MNIETQVLRGHLASPSPNSSRETSTISVDFFMDYIKQVQAQAQVQVNNMFWAEQIEMSES